MGAADDHDSHEQLLREARALAGEFAQRGEAYLAGLTARGHEQGDHASDSGCGWCPLCAVVAALRGQRPELADKLATQASALLATLREGLHEHAPNGGGRDSDGDNGSEASADSPDDSAENSRVQRIKVRRSKSGESPC